MTRRTLKWALPLVAVVAIALLTFMARDYDEQDWSSVASDGCRAGAFGSPHSLQPPELRKLRGELAAGDEDRLWNALQVAVNEFAENAFHGVQVNLNCSLDAYDPDALNVYFVINDPGGRFAFANGMILTRTDAKRVIVFGQRFWDFFSKGWDPILRWRTETADPRLLSALGDLYIDAYEFYLEWVIAHELGHIRLNHKAASPWLTSHNQQELELAADIEAARTLRGEYRQASPHLLGLLKETMKYYFGRTYGRPWTSQDGEAFESNGVASFRTTDWQVNVPTCLMLTHPPFLLRSVTMLEVISTVAKEQAAQIQAELKKNEMAALAEENSIESELAMEQLKEAQDELDDLKLTQWATAMGGLAEQLRRRIHPTRTWRLSCPD